MSRVLRSTLAPFCVGNAASLKSPDFCLPCSSPNLALSPIPGARPSPYNLYFTKPVNPYFYQGIVPIEIRQFPNSVLVVALLLAPAPALGWGAEGHEDRGRRGAPRD